MVSRLSLFKLFGDFAASWPRSFIGPEIGVDPTDAEYATWLTAFNEGVRLSEVRPASGGGRIAVEAKIAIHNGSTPYPEGLPFVFAAMPDIEFRLQSVPMTTPARLYVAQEDAGVTALVEGLPVEIRLPPGFISPHPDVPSGELGPTGSVSVGKFIAGKLDTQEIVYRAEGESSIFVHLRIHVDADGGAVIRPAVPISFGRCKFLDVPCLAVHDFQLIPSPAHAARDLDWPRHSLTPWEFQAPTPRTGFFAVRSVQLDPAHDPIKQVVEFLTGNAQRNPKAAFVLDDLAIPFFSDYVLPIPRHVTLGVRREAIDPHDAKEVFAFAQAPISVRVSKDPAIDIIVESMFFRSPSAKQIETGDFGLTFSSLVGFGEQKASTATDQPGVKHAVTLELAENATLRLGYRRNFNLPDELLNPPGGGTPLYQLFHWEIGDVYLDLVGAKLGYSIGRAVGEKAGFWDCAEVLVDLFVQMPPTGSASSPIRLRSLNGENVSFALQGIGWRQGGMHLEGAVMPDGVALYLGPAAVILQELGTVADTGATYFSFSGGLAVDPPGGFEGGVLLKRARVRITKHPSAPSFKLDGIFAFFTAKMFEIAAGGYFTDTVVDSQRVEEFGMAGKLLFKPPIAEFGFSLDLIIGQVAAPAETFKYFMFQLVVNGAIPVYSLELRSIRLLFARNMVPKLSQFDANSGDMRYFNWYRATDPLKVPGDRRLAAWKPTSGAVSAGLGCGVGLTGLSVIAQIRGFLLVVVSDPENGALFTLELLLGISKDPVAYAAIELDFENDRYALLFGCDLSLKKFISFVPSWMDTISRLTGTIFVTNKPATIAIGRIGDTRSWLSALFDLDLFVFRTFFQLGFCLEIVEGGPKGVGFILRVEGGISAGVVRITYFGGIGFVLSTFQTGSADFALAAFIEGGIRAVLFGFLRFGLGVRAELRQVGFRPSRTEMSIVLRFETPWFLPDITFKIECTSGRLAPGELATATSPLRSASAQQPLTEQSRPIHAERFDAGWDGNGPTRTWSVAEFRNGVTPEGIRLANFADDKAVAPIATDATIALEFSIALNNRLNVNPGGTGPFGEQMAQDLKLQYELIGWKIRRRPRFVAEAPWTVVDQAVAALGADFSDPDNVTLTGTIGPQELTLFWDQDIRIEGQTAARKLLVNSSTPFSFATSNPEADEQAVAANPYWPCCPPPGRYKPGRRLLHVIAFWDDIPGASVAAGRKFSESNSRFFPESRAVARPRQVGVALPADAIVAGFDEFGVGPLFRAELDDDAILCTVQLAWLGAVPGTLELVAFDVYGRAVGWESRTFAGFNEQQTISLLGLGPIRRFELRLVSVDPSLWPKSLYVFSDRRMRQVIEVAQAGYVRLVDYVAEWFEDEHCNPDSDDFKTAYEGKGKLFFLPNHEYELEVTTRISTKHVSLEAEAATLTEYAYFATKGLPGLNAAARTGEEIEPYVARAYTGTRGLIYREEPVTLAFKEDFHLAVPLAVRPPGSSPERMQLFRMAMTVRPETAGTTTSTYTSATSDWIVAHRTFTFEQLVTWTPVVATSELSHSRMRSISPTLQRLATLTQRPDARCPLADPRDVIGPVLIAHPQGPTDPGDPGQPLWPASARYTATVRPEGSGFIDRPSFVEADKTALDFAVDGAVADGSAWSLANGELRVTSGGARQFALFGEPDWNHVTARLAVTLASGTAGLGIALPATDIPTQGLFAVAETSSGGARMAIYRRGSGAEMVLLAAQRLAGADPSALVISVDAFDDKIRLSCGETRVEVDRGALREGRVGLLAQGNVGFRSLELQGLPLYTFPFGISRYRSFASHIGSFGGQIDKLAPDMMGAGTTATTVATLLGTTHAAIPSTMRAIASEGERDVLFRRWVDGLALPLKQEVVALSIAAYTEGAGTELLLLETPEPLDFAGAVTATLERRVTSFGKLPWHDMVVGVLAKTTVGQGLERQQPVQPIATAARRIKLLRAQVGEIALPHREAARARPVATAATIAGIERSGSELRVDFGSGAALDRDHPVTLLSIGEARHGRLAVEVFEGSVGRKTAGQLYAKGRQSRAILVDETVIPTGTAIKDLAGAVIALDPEDGRIIDWFMPRVRYVPVAATVLQDGAGLRALIVPGTGAAISPLGPGHYRLSFAINRKRWDTHDSAQLHSAYARKASLDFAL